ncbi:hypothetical protein BS50DRAFT_573136 [Corynespora cassiicola Philippines]|uniref:Cohesin loading factor-domain-containing protein n=1 Tax=Corynespora cassiicola Philippines TaxID=1448308 RepID=A0A2T2NRW9_CORCC|nr:hypothetical protein BS50DRAFT_573136 [Corynespora cassiicola Philippines]
MDPRYNWPPQGYHNNQYAQYPPPQQSNGYPQNGYPQQYPQQPPMQMQHGYPQSQPVQRQPQVIISPRPGQPPQQQYAQMHDNMRPQPQPQPRAVQPQVVIPARNPHISPMSQMQNPRIRQVQVPVQRQGQSQGQGHRLSSSGMVERGQGHGHSRPPPPPATSQAQRPPSKPAQPSPAHQENVPRPQHQRPPPGPNQNQSQHRAPLQPHSTPQQRTPSLPQTPSNQQRSPALPQTTPHTKSHPQVVIQKPKSQPLQTPTKSQHAPSSKALPADLQILLISAADEYIAAARAMGSVAALKQRKADLEQYYRLMAMGLSCMDSVLRKFHLAPRREAEMRLRYANLLIEETDNDMEIEQTLSKGITVCNRNRLLDLKYAMQHLQARWQFKSSGRAALKSLDQPISETETFQHIVWVYAFRFLKASLSLQMPRPETASAVQQLHAIAAHAEKRGDRAIFVTCSAMEAMIHLRSSAPDHLEHVQRAIAAARSLQLQTSVKQLGQIATLIDCIDIACSIQQGRPDAQKLETLQEKVDQDAGSSSGAFSVLVEKSFGGNLTISTGGVFKKAEDGRDELVFSWLPRSDLKTLAYYLSGMTTLPHDKGLNYLHEGFRLTQDSVRRPANYRISIPAAITQKNWMKVLDWHVRFATAVAACYHENLGAAGRALKSLQDRVGQQPFNNLEQYARMMAYLSGVLDQSNGSIDSALVSFSSPLFELPRAGTLDLKTDLALLATMNRLLIIRDPRHPDHYTMGPLLAQLEPTCLQHPNHYIEGAFRIIRAITNTNDTVITRQKTLIHVALATSQKTQNFQFIGMCLNYMTSKFFADQVGEQAVKSVRAARSVAKQGRSVLWRAVAYGLCINTFQRNGLLEDANACQQAVEELRGKLPAPLRGGVAAVDRDGDVKME